MVPATKSSPTLSIIDAVPERTAVVKQLPVRTTSKAKSVLGLIACFLLGVLAAAILVYTFF